jgi:hypothetical protein
MMAPWFQHAQLLYTALNEATAVLRAPIDRIEVVPGKILFSAKRKVLLWSRTKMLAISYQYIASSSEALGASPRLLLNGKSATTFNAVPREMRTAPQPWDERKELLYAAISKATYALQAGIDRIEVGSDKIRLQADRKELAISYQYADNPGGRPAPRGFLLDGEDYWECFKS